MAGDVFGVVLAFAVGLILRLAGDFGSRTGVGAGTMGINVFYPHHDGEWRRGTSKRLRSGRWPRHRRLVEVEPGDRRCGYGG